MCCDSCQFDLGALKMKSFAARIKESDKIYLVIGVKDSKNNIRLVDIQI